MVSISSGTRRLGGLSQLTDEKGSIRPERLVPIDVGVHPGLNPGLVFGRERKELLCQRQFLVTHASLSSVVGG